MPFHRDVLVSVFSGVSVNGTMEYSSCRYSNSASSMMIRMQWQFHGEHNARVLRAFCRDH